VDAARVLPFSLDVLRRTIGDRIEEDLGSIRAWIDGGAEPEFPPIAERALAALDTLLRRRWLRLDEEWTVRLSRAVPAAQAPELPDHRAAVVEVLEVVAWALRSELGPLQPR